MARALRIAEQELSRLRLESKIKDQQIAELQPKATYYNLILQWLARYVYLLWAKL